MNPTTAAAIENLKRREETNSSKMIDIIAIERRQREFINELSMKRNQIETLRKDLDTAHLKIFELNRCLETTKFTLDEQECNLNLIIKNSRNLEDKLQDKRNSIIKSQLQRESAVEETKTLKDHYQKSELEKNDLIRQVEDLKAQHHCDTVYQKELINQDIRIKTALAELTNAVQEIKNDHSTILELSKNTKVCENLQSSVQYYKNELDHVKAEKTTTEETLIVTQGMADKIEHLLKDSQIFFNEKESDYILEQWRKNVENLSNEMNLQKKHADELAKNLIAEKTANTKLCLRADQLEIAIEELQQKLRCKDCVDVAVQVNIPQAAENFIKSEVEIVD